MEKTTKIEMNDGSQKFLADLLFSNLPDVKLVIKTEGKHKGESYITLKSEVVSETPTHKVERRLFKWATMPRVAMYDLSIAKSLPQFVKDAGEQTVYDYAIGNYAIDMDKQNNGMEGKGLTKQAKAVGKGFAAMEATATAEAKANTATVQWLLENPSATMAEITNKRRELMKEFGAK